MISKPQLVLKALLLGLKVKLEDYTWLLNENPTTKNEELSIRLYQLEGDKITVIPDKVGLADISFNQFLVLASKLTDSEAIGITAAIVLSKGLSPA